MLLPQAKILRDRHRRSEARLLTHPRDAELQRLKGEFPAALSRPFINICPCASADHSRHYLGECGLQRPVFTDKRMDLTWKQRKIYVLYRGNACHFFVAFLSSTIGSIITVGVFSRLVIARLTMRRRPLAKA